ncbi:MAG: hypothetical protein IRZ16_04780 [Myxococcaceae bacterium]|nr:hypothetical protein [Myxococcaceae bacterium]
MNRLLCVTAAASLATFVGGCDLQKTGSQIKAEKTLVATLLATPPVVLDPATLAGLDAGTFDAGTIPVDGGTVTLPPQTAAFVFWGERDNSALDQPPEPLTGAEITVGAEGGTTFELKEVGDGNYQLTSQDDDAFAYQPRADYVFTVEHEGETHVARVEDTPELEQIPDLHPSQGFVDHPAGTPLTLHRPPPVGKERNLGFVTVFPLSESGERGQPTWTNVPDEPLEFLKLAARPGDWRKDTITVDGSAFPEPNRTYLLVMQAVKLGGAESANLFKASPVLAGTAEVGVFRTR